MENNEIEPVPETEESAPASRVWGPWATIGFGVVVMVVSFIVQAVVAVGFIAVLAMKDINPSAGSSQLEDIIEIIMGITGEYSGMLVSLAVIISGIICFGLILLIVKVLKGATITGYLGFNPVGVKTILFSLVVVIGFIALSGGISMWRDIPQPEYMIDVYATSVWPWLLWIAVVIFAPLFEETFFRGFLFEGFRRSKIGLIGAIGITSFFWAVFHVQYGFYEIATIFVLGIVMGIVRYRTESLWSTMAMHAFFNAVAMLELTLS